MANLTPQKERDIRTWIGSKLTGLPFNTTFLRSIWYYTGKQEFIQRNFLSVADTIDVDKFECDFVMLYALRPQASLTQGCEDNPVRNIFYNLHIFKSFVEVRDDNSISEDDLMELIITVENKMLINLDHPSMPGVSHTGLTPRDNIQRGVNSPFLRNVVGDYINMQFSVEVNT